MAMKVEVMSKEVIKPASATPDHLRTIPLTLFDQFMPQTYINSIFFYSITSDNSTVTQATFPHKLKISLSEILTRFFPLAGRIEGTRIDCNDEGALFTEARADILLSDFLRTPDVVSLKQLIVNPFDYLDHGSWPLLHVKVTFFTTEAVAVAASVSHKIFDTASFIKFVRIWAATVKGCVDKVNPQFIASAFYPPADLSVEVPPLMPLRKKSITKRFVFRSSNIHKLKTRVASEHVMNHTRVEAITALLYSAIKGSRSNESFTMTQSINLRPRLPSTLLPPDAMGNLLYSPLLNEDSESEIKITEMVSKLRKTKEELNEIIMEETRGTESTASKLRMIGERIAMEMLSSLSESRAETNVYVMTSFCRMPFYEVDFGWGTPLWIASYVYEMSRLCILMDAKDGEGIEAWVTLPEEDMSAFEQHQDLVAAEN
ncbi:PREDICTED: BAHD acyltransferase At5g47980-like [Tarenaya hassleriana]|uniref:BAHD acyltransferase At5g47980-like n=1 Tax=Tarenaya hassleriana TaxID=28532 RepID=UPI00053C4B4D|nr:PREDICTED: BAHD acyltransferase At5g47980-like [Tarenaya hassleriana]